LLCIFVKPLSNGDVAVAFVNKCPVAQTLAIDFASLELNEKYEIWDLKRLKK